MLKERFQTQKATYYMIFFILMSRIGKCIEKKVDQWLPEPVGRENEK